MHDHNKCCVMVFGRLIVEGTAQSPVMFGAGSEWGGLHFLGDGAGILKNAVFEDSVSEGVALWDRSGADMESLLFQRCWAGVGAYGTGRARLKDCRAVDMREGGLFCEGGFVEWEGGGWQGGKTGVRLCGGSARLRKLEGSGAERGLLLESGNLRGDDLVLKHHRDAALSLLEEGSAVISGSRFEGGCVGVVSKGARAELVDCEFSGFTEIGVELAGRGHRLERVSIRGGEIGVVMGSGRAEARELRTDCVGTGVDLRSGAELDWSGGGTTGGAIGVRVAGGTLRFRDASCTGSEQGIRLESGSLEGSGLVLKAHRDAALSLLADGSAHVRGARIEDCPVGVVTAGAKLALRSVRFLRCSSVCLSVEAGAHAIDDCFFDPTCRDLEIGAGAEVRRDGDVYLRSGLRPRASAFAALWRLVLLTGNAPVLRSLYHAVYAAAVSRLRGWARGEARVAGALIGRGWVTGDWEPGVSDLDFLLIAERLDGPGGAAWLKKFWRTFGRWRRWFPFLGEVLIASPEDMTCYLKWGGARARELGSQTWVLKGSGLAGPSAAPDRFAPLQALQECAHAYTRYMQWEYFPGQTPPEAVSRQRFKAVVDLQRYGRAARDGAMTPVATRTDFLRELETGDPAAWNEARSASGSTGGLHAAVLRRLHDSARGLLGSGIFEEKGAASAAFRWLPPAVDSHAPEVASRHMEEVAGLQACFGAVFRSYYRDDLYRSYVVLEDEAVEIGGLSAALERWRLHRLQSPHAGPLPVIVSRSLFAAWRRLPYLENPVSCLEFGGSAGMASAGSWFPNCRQFRWGAAEPAAAAPDALVRRLALESAANLRLTWRLLGSPANRLSSVYVLHYLFSRTLGLRLLLERGVGVSFFDLDGLVRAWRENFPETGAALDRLPPEEWMGSSQAAFFARYEFLDEQIGRLGDS